jgi:hypothetical protein
MTLSDFATFTTAISGMAVTVSIIYLAMQTHQNTKHTRAQINQGRVALLAELLLAGTDADVATATLLATTGSATPEAVRKCQFQFYFAAQMFGWQDSFSQYERGLLDEDIYKAMVAAVDQSMALPALRERLRNAVPDARHEIHRVRGRGDREAAPVRCGSEQTGLSSTHFESRGFHK